LRSAPFALLLAAAAAQLACATFPGYPAGSERAVLEAVGPHGGSVRLNATFEQFLNGVSKSEFDSQYVDYLNPVTDAYRQAGVFDRIADSRERPSVVADVRAYGLAEGSAGWRLASWLTLLLVPNTRRTGVEVETVLRDAGTQAEIGRSQVCRAMREVQSVFLFPALVTNATKGVEDATLAGLAGVGLAAAAEACPASARLSRPRSFAGVAPALGAEARCNQRPGVRAYIRHFHDQVQAQWDVKQGGDERGTIAIRLRADGSIDDIRTEGPGDPDLTAKTVAAVQAAAPFGPLDGPLDCLREVPIRLDFRARR
jgi:hypothetical protein